MASLAVLLPVVLAEPAPAFVSVVPAPDFPAVVTVGDTFGATLGVGNFSTSPDSGTPLHITQIDLVPACTSAVPNCAGGIEAGVFRLSPTATGSSGPASCLGTWTVTEITPGTFRFTPPGGEGTLSLLGGEVCVVDFTAEAVRVPTNDIGPGPGKQASQLQCVSVTNIPVTIRNCGTDQTTVDQGPTTLSTQATPATPLGQPISDAATLAGPPPPAASPTGFINFTAFGPNDPLCAGTPAYAAGPIPVAAFGSFDSGDFTPSAPGGYNWVATYSGDGNYLAADSPCGAPDETSLVVGIVTHATPSVALGGPASDTATVSGGTAPFAVPTGTVTFNAFGPNDATCSGPPVLTSTRPLGGGPPPTATSGPFTPTAVGSYRWVATYNGDANYSVVSTACNDPNETTVVNPPSTASPIAVYRPSNGFWFFYSGPTTQFGTTRDIAVPADYDGNGTLDVAVFRRSNGTWYIQDGPAVQWGAANDLPVPADYDGDGDDDIAVFRPSNGIWYVRGGPTVQFGVNGDVPVPADYDGDGDDDIAVFRPATSTWYVLGGGGSKFGFSGDIPVPADYDGDGDDDIAVFRPSNGVWYVQGGAAVQWGTSGDIPVPANYDGDAAAEIAVFRPSNGIWYVPGGPVVQFGTSGDRPLPLPAAVRMTYFL